MSRIPDLQAATADAASAARIVLDTNVVLDWLWFCDRRVDHLAASVQSGRLRWLATPAMRDELRAVVERLAALRPDRVAEQVLTSFDLLVCPAEPGQIVQALRCTDVADQKFLDLAVAGGARWLLTRDRAVLRLARRAQPFGVDILVPERWGAPLGT